VVGYSLWAEQLPIEIRRRTPDRIAARSSPYRTAGAGVASKIEIPPVKIRYTANRIRPIAFTTHITILLKFEVYGFG
jgi:hypothetical protein